MSRVAEVLDTGSRCGRCAGGCDTCEWIEDQLAALVVEPAQRSERARRGEQRPFLMAELEQAMRARSSGEAARRLRVSMSTMKRLRSTGLTVWQADVYACRAGLHPGLVWPEWWDPVG